MKEFMTAEEIADLLNVSKRSVQMKARRHAWPFKSIRVRGGSVRLYPIQKLPYSEAIRIIQGNNKTAGHDQ